MDAIPKNSAQINATQGQARVRNRFRVKVRNRVSVRDSWLVYFHYFCQFRC